jgi:hypothetical protein
MVVAAVFTGFVSAIGGGYGQYALEGSEEGWLELRTVSGHNNGRWTWLAMTNRRGTVGERERQLRWLVTGWHGAFCQLHLVGREDAPWDTVRRPAWPMGGRLGMLCS